LAGRRLYAVVVDIQVVFDAVVPLQIIAEKRMSSRKRIKAKKTENKAAANRMFRAMLDQVRLVPYGKVVTYGDVAYAAGFPGGARQVAWALHGNFHGLPWHRVIGAGGKILLGGEGGFEQRMRLQAEGVQFLGLRVDMDAHHHSFFRKRR
jgi:methylated-DNA-protein-cysteine methyltransferase-like protein